MSASCRTIDVILQAVHMEIFLPDNLNEMMLFVFLCYVCSSFDTECISGWYIAVGQCQCNGFIYI